MKKSLVLWGLIKVFLLCSVSLEAQKLDRRQGEIILCLHSSTDKSDLERRFTQFKGRESSFNITRCLSREMNLWLAKVDYTRVDETQFLREVQANPLVRIAQFNHFLKSRDRSPNDPGLEEQWQWINLGQRGVPDSDIDAEQAWGITTGGTTALGDTIVVAVIDVGVDFEHEDLKANIWKNRQEIPGNRQDDDNNGYVDDYLGWNVLLENDNIEPELFGGGVPETHGTEILGLIGGVGNNGVGVSGLNWQVKMMNVFFNKDLNEADMIAAYSYVLTQRKIYNQTGGERGAFVVATVLSYGDEDLDPEDTPIWCAVYDSLGREGILNCTATANTNINIDSIKDVPTSCNSEYMISVTATNASDIRSFAAYGKNDIDLAAPGSQVYTTTIPGYDFVTGTSYATPIVGGAIALLYASPCADLAALSRRDPSAAALAARDLILKNVEPVPGLQDFVSTGGRLNVFNSINATLAACQSCIAPFNIIADVGEELQSLILQWEEADSVTRTLLNWRLQGDTIWSEVDSVRSPFALNGLDLCTNYEIQLISFCTDESSTPSGILTINTGGCCVPADNIEVEVLNESQVNINWSGTLTATAVQFIYGISGDALAPDTLRLPLSATTGTLDSLTGCSTYDLVIQSICVDGSLQISDTVRFRTFGCGACLDSVYCMPENRAVGDEWIERVQLGTLDNHSGFDGGYGDYTGEPTILKQGNSYQLVIDPGFASDTLNEFYFAWVDYNQDGHFDDVSERIFASDSATSGRIEIPWDVPQDAPVGITRLRLLMLFDPVEDTVSACNTVIDLGETEDYCVEFIIDSLLCPLPQNIDTMDFQLSSTLIVWERVDSAIAYIVRHRKVGEDKWEELVDTMPSFAMMELEECQQYEVQVQTVCARDTSGFSESFVFSSFCSTSTTDEISPNLRARVFPNPFHHQLTVEIETGTAQAVEIRLLQLNGQIIQRQVSGVIPGRQLLEIPETSRLHPGMYLLIIQNREGRMVRKVLKG